MRYTLGRDATGQAYDLRDPRAALLTPPPDLPVTPEGLHDRLAAIPDLIPARLTKAPGWRDAVIARLSLMLDKGMRAAIETEATR